MESIYTMTAATTAPAFGMPVAGSTCARPVHGRNLGWAGAHTDAAALALQGTTVSAAVRIKGVFPGHPAWSPPTS